MPSHFAGRTFPLSKRRRCKTTYRQRKLRKNCSYFNYSGLRFGSLKQSSRPRLKCMNALSWCSKALYSIRMRLPQLYMTLTLPYERIKQTWMTRTTLMTKTHLKTSMMIKSKHNSNNINNSKISNHNSHSSNSISSNNSHSQLQDSISWAIWLLSASSLTKSSILRPSLAHHSTMCSTCKESDRWLPPNKIAIQDRTAVRSPPWCISNHSSRCSRCSNPNSKLHPYWPRRAPDKKFSPCLRTLSQWARRTYVQTLLFKVSVSRWLA